MAETSKAFARRSQDGFFELIGPQRSYPYLGIDIGCGNDPVNEYCDLFEKEKPDNGIPPATTGTLYTGDAHTMEGVPREHYDYVYASHIIEHLEDPVLAIQTWFSLLKPGGILIIFAPNRDTYERRRLLPSQWNADHKSFWLLESNDPPHTWSLCDVITRALDNTGCFYLMERAKVCSDGWKELPLTEHPVGEYSLEVAVRKTV